MNKKKKTYLWPKRCQRHLLGSFVCSSSYGAVFIACAFLSCPVLIIPLVVSRPHCFGRVVLLSVSASVPVIVLWWSWLPFFFVVVPSLSSSSLSSPCQLLMAVQCGWLTVRPSGVENHPVFQPLRWRNWVENNLFWVGFSSFIAIGKRIKIIWFSAKNIL